MFDELTNEELAEKINSVGYWDMDALQELCKRVDMADEWEAADEYEFEAVAYRAAEILGVSID